MDQSDSSVVTAFDERLAKSDIADFWTPDDCDEPLDGLPFELTNGAFKPRDLEGAARSLHLKITISDLLGLKAASLFLKATSVVVIALTWLLFGIVLSLMVSFLCSSAILIVLAIGTRLGISEARIFEISIWGCILAGYGISSWWLLPYLKQAVSKRDRPSIPRFGRKVACMAVASLGVVCFFGWIQLQFDDSVNHIRDWSVTKLSWRDRYKLRRITRGVSLPNTAQRIWARGSGFSPDPWDCVTFRCRREDAVKFVEEVAGKPLDRFKTTFNSAEQPSRFGTFLSDDKDRRDCPWRGTDITDVRFVEFLPSEGGVALDLTTNTVYVIRD